MFVTPQDRIRSRLDMTAGEKQVKLQQAALRRQELLDRLKTERILHQESTRPKTQSPHQRNSPSPGPPSRRSLPELSKARVPSRQVIEHQVKIISDKPDSLNINGNGPHNLPVQPLPPPHPYYSPYPSPYIPEKTSSKSDIMEMMLLQNAQMHQMVMHQMVLGTLPQKPAPQPYVPPVIYQTPRVPVALPYKTILPKEIPRSDPVPVLRPHTIQPVDPTPVPMLHPPPRQYILPAIDTQDIRYTKPKVQQYSPVIEKVPVKVKQKRKYPFPGSGGIRKMRRLFHAVWFIKILQALVKKNKGKRRGNVFHLRLSDLITSLHAIYLEKSGNIEPLLTELSQSTNDYSKLVTKKFIVNEKTLISKFTKILEKLVYHVTDIMPSTGSLGTNRNSDMYELIRSGQKFPPNFFYSIEKDILTFDGSGCVVHIGDNGPNVLLMSMFFTRGLITTLLIRPQNYELARQLSTSVTGKNNFQLLATCIMWIVRKCSQPPGSAPLTFPKELEADLFSDETMLSFNGKIKRTYAYCEKMIREWQNEYVSRLKAAS